MVQAEDLRPYISLTLCRLREDRARVASGTVLVGLSTVLQLAETEGPRQLIERREPEVAGEVDWGLLHYREQQSPGWTNAEDVVDQLNHLVLVIRRERYFALLLSDSSRTSSIVRSLGGSIAGLADLELMPEDVLNAAFLLGPARTVWMSGIHRRTSVKADSKVLTGIDLRDAIDPLADQSYFPTAARASVDLQGKNITIGVASRRSGVWIGASRDWTEFIATTSRILQTLEETEAGGKRVEDPLPILARSLTRTASLDGAFDISILPPEAETQADQDAEVRQLLERWAYQAEFDVVRTAGPNFEMDVLLEGRLIGRIKVELDAADPKRVVHEVSGRPEQGCRAEFDEVLRVCRNRRWLQIRYESGHTVSDGCIYEQRLRDHPFPAWRFPDFTGFDVSTEKPMVNGVFSPDHVGKKDSLFCWVVKNWPLDEGPRGWLACDDGAMEMADFLHLDDDRTPPILSLIHAKGFKGGASRGVSVSPYELVAAQAIKNLRALDQRIASEGLASGVDRAVRTLVWHNGRKLKGRDPMLAALQEAGADVDRQVVILQPHLRREQYEAARTDQRAGRITPAVRRMRHLDWLLTSIDGNARDLGASILALGDGTPDVPSQAAPRRRRS